MVMTLKVYVPWPTFSIVWFRGIASLPRKLNEKRGRGADRVRGKPATSLAR